ncbi:hypothetical protein TeGR_g4815 [Tetraparma gracilis]|uniref:Uncharacterized protein n=1 Tax=Tetraparma gracilis TaxID=2962635 RepID=A0ABQ6N5Q7_9STRA|nr:hypothetical protein TeGR_g4815 [Tetraparma gracilis]
MPKIQVGKISRRPHPADVASQLPPDLTPHPTIVNDEIMKASSDARMYSYWGQTAANSLGVSPNPIGNTTSMRSCQSQGADLGIGDPKNM